MATPADTFDQPPTAALGPTEASPGGAVAMPIPTERRRPPCGVAVSDPQVFCGRLRRAARPAEPGVQFQVVGCSHRGAPIAIRERLAFSPAQTAAALRQFRQRFPAVEAVLLSTCNRVEWYTATENGRAPGLAEMAEFLGRFHRIDPEPLLGHLALREDGAAVRHLFAVAASLESMVLGEPQILAQVKEAYQFATQQQATGPITHAAFQTAVKVARRVANETSIAQRRVSIPSVAVADFARQIFERFDDKRTLVLGAGKMAEETLQYLRDEGARDVTVVNRSFSRAVELARCWQGRAAGWAELPEALTRADLVISTTGAGEPVVGLAAYRRLAPARRGRPLFVLDLAVPRDFDPAIGELPDVYLYSVDDLEAACERHRHQRRKQLPAALRIVEAETADFMAMLHYRATAPIIRQLCTGWQKPKEDELKRLLGKLPHTSHRARKEIGQSFDRLVNKLMHPMLELLRDESRDGVPHPLLEAISTLFQLED